MANVIVYTRVSTDEQAAKGTSLPFQKERLHQFCEVAGNNVVACFTEDYSAKNFEDRPEFNKLLAFLKESKSIIIDKLLVLRWDRFSRNAPEAYNMIKTLTKMGVEVNAIEQPIDFSIPEQKMMLSFYLTIPEIENDRRAMNTTNGMRKNMREGRWVSTAPIGYKNARDSFNKPILIKTDKAGLVKKAYELFATGTYPIDVLRKEMAIKGLSLSKNPFWVMLRNPLYYGKVRVKAYLKEPEEIVQGLHEPIISEDLFNEVQDVLLGKKKIKAKKTKTRVELPLRGYLVCNSCGKNLTGSSSKGNGGKYFYYHCQPGCNERHNTEFAHKCFEKWLNDITIKTEVAQLYLAVMEDVFKTNEGDRDTEIKKLETEIVNKTGMLSKATQKLISDEIDRNDFKRVKDSLNKESIDLQLRINELKKADSGFIEYSSYSLSLLSNLKHYYTTSTLENKQKMIGLIFPEKLVFSNKSYRTNEINEVLEFLTSNSKGFGVSTKEKVALKSDLSCMVAGPIELSNQFEDDLIAVALLGKYIKSINNE